MNKTVYIHSCHATLEYDHASMLKNLGYRVIGRFDRGSIERPKVQGITDQFADIADVKNEVGVILLHQCEDYPVVMEDYLKQGLKVVLSVFGQGCDEQHKETVITCLQY